MAKIVEIKARQILDSRDNPTVEVEVTLEDGSVGRSAVPSGASTGKYEAVELRDGGEIFGGMGVTKAIANIHGEIATNVLNKELDQNGLDQMLISLDGTENKSRLGANAILAVSMAFSHAASLSLKLPLYQYFNNLSGNSSVLKIPVPLLNFINGGRHAKNSTDVQEFMVVPFGFKKFSEAIQAGTEIYDSLAEILSERNLGTAVGDEGGFAPALGSNEAALKLLVEAIIKAGYKPGEQVGLALDVAASELYKDGRYYFTTENKDYSASELLQIYQSWLSSYPIVSLEDGFAEDDWDNWKVLTDTLGKSVQLVGDDLFVTNKTRLQMGIDKGIANSILIKPNQIGTISETIETVLLASKNNYSSIISHRSGETEDTTIADLAVGLGTGQIKSGSVSRTERVAKYNQILRIEEELDDNALFQNPFKLS